jgi:hypothetical protein
MADHTCPLTKRSCSCDPGHTEEKYHPCRITSRIAVFIGMMGSEHKGERESAALGLCRFVASEGLPATDLAMIMAHSQGLKKKYTDDEMKENLKKVYEKGLNTGHAEEASSRPISVASDYFDADGNPQWHAIALYCQKHGAHLDAKERDFFDDMVIQMRHHGPRSGKQGGWLLSLFYQLGNGKRR